MQDIQLNPALLSKLLGTTINNIQVAPLRTGYTSNVSRVRFDGQSIIVKQSASTPFADQLADRFHAREKEARFYRDLAARTRVNLPEVLFLQTEPFILGLRDLGDASTNLIERGASLAQTDQAVQCLAMLHADFNATNTDGLTSFTDTMTAAEPDLQSFVRDCLKAQPASHARDLLLTYASRSRQFQSLFNGLPQRFAHMDFRLNNFRFGDGVNADDFTLFDWGDYGLAPVGFDLAYFMVTSVTAANRRKWEANVLDSYFARLSADLTPEHPDQALTFESLFDGYRLSLLPAVYLPALMLEVDADKTGARQMMDQYLMAVQDHHTWLQLQLDSIDD
jgi:hypothetical protein